MIVKAAPPRKDRMTRYLHRKYMPAAFLVCALTALLLVSCGGPDEPGGSNDGTPLPNPAIDRSEDPWKIVVTLPLFAEMAREMGGDQVSVTTLIPPGEDPHTYVPDEILATAVDEADIVFVNGLGLDQPAIDFIEEHRPPRRFFLVDIVRNVPSPSTEQPLGGRPIYAKEAGDEPHLWMDPVLARIYVETIEHSLVIIDGLNESFYDARFAVYKTRLQELDATMAAEMEKVPPENRSLIVSYHGSLIHFANRYGLEIAGTLQEEGEEGLRAIIESERPPAIFGEFGFDDSALRVLADEAEIEICELNTDSVEDGVSYFEMVERNAEQLVTCLGG